MIKMRWQQLLTALFLILLTFLAGIIARYIDSTIISTNFSENVIRLINKLDIVAFIVLVTILIISSKYISIYKIYTLYISGALTAAMGFLFFILPNIDMFTADSIANSISNYASYNSILLNFSSIVRYWHIFVFHIIYKILMNPVILSVLIYRTLINKELQQ